MDGLLIAGAGALWLGILTSISPCPLASNIAAISFISKEVSNSRRTLLNGVCYAFGRTLSYVVLAVVLIKGLLAVPDAANWLQGYMNVIFGPLLILVGMFLLELLVFSLPSFLNRENITNKVKDRGMLGTVALGSIFALSFCPVSAALYFGTLVPLSIKHESWFFLPLLYGLGTALPVVVFGTIMAIGAGRLGQAFSCVTGVEIWARRTTGLVFIAVGVWYSCVYLLMV